MIQNYEYFLAVAESGNLNIAAKHLYMTEQGLSAYIRKLEEEYKVVLFIRSPKLKLTPAGEFLYQQLKKRLAEDRFLKAKMGEYSEETNGKIRVMIQSQASAIFPHIGKKFWAEYPHVSIEIETGIKINHVRALKEGVASIYIGPTLEKAVNLICIPLASESTQVIVTESVLWEKFHDKTDAMIKKYKEKGISLRDLTGLPLILPNNKSMLTNNIYRFCEEHEIDLFVRYHYAERAEACEIALSGNGAAVVSVEFGWQRRFIPCCQKGQMDTAYVFTIRSEDLPIRNYCIAYSTKHPILNYQKRFIEIVTDSFAEKPEKWNDYKRDYIPENCCYCCENIQDIS